MAETELPVADASKVAQAAVVALESSDLNEDGVISGSTEWIVFIKSLVETVKEL